MLAETLYEMGFISKNEYEQRKNNMNKKQKSIHNMIDKNKDADDIIRAYDELII